MMKPLLGNNSLLKSRTLIFWIGVMMMIGQATAEKAKGPLRVHPTNPRYFTDGSGKAIYLAGWNIWSNLQDGYGTAWEYGWGNPFDYEAYLDDLVSNNLNYIRLWLYETAKVAYPGVKYKGSSPDVPTPNPWERTGPGKAADAGLKFDLTKYNQAYFDRLKSRLAVAGQRGIYVSVMLFEGFSIRGKTHQAWPYHPFNSVNNINGIDGDKADCLMLSNQPAAGSTLTHHN